MSLWRTLKNIKAGGLRQYAHNMMYIGDAKVGKLVGEDSNGNKFYENLEEVPGRHRWVDYAQDDFNASQVDPAWHSWLHHIRMDPPNQDEIVKANTPTWIAPAKENLTGTRGAFKTYSTTAPKIYPWTPKVAERH